MTSVKKVLISVSIFAPLAFSSVAYAHTVPSDFARDVKAGLAQQNGDPTTKAVADEINSDEDTTGRIDDGETNVEDTTINQEDNMSDPQTGEVSDPTANSSSNSDSANDNGNTPKMNDGGNN